MTDDFNFELRASWREFDVPDSERASRDYEKHQFGGARNESLFDQAISIIRSTYNSDRETARELLKQLAGSSELAMPVLARAVVDAAHGAPERSDNRAAQVASKFLSGAEPAGRSIDLRDAERTSRLSGAG